LDQKFHGDDEKSENLNLSQPTMQSTHVQTVEVIAGVEPLRLRYSMPNERYLVSAFSRGSSILSQKLATLQSLRSPKMIRKFSIVQDMNIQPNISNYNRPFDALLHSPKVDTEIRRELLGTRRDSLSTIAPQIVSSITARYARESVIFTDGSRIDGKTGFGVFHGENFEMGFRLVEPSDIFTAELTAIFYALEHIRSHSPGRYLILTDSLSSVQALQTRVISPKGHPLIYDCKEAFWRHLMIYESAGSHLMSELEVMKKLTY
jgi:RNase H